MCCTSANGLNTSIIYHLFALGFATASCIFVLLVLFDGVPIGSTPLHSPDEAFWLITLNETSTSTDPFNANHKEMKYGFGVWGWCEWSALTPQLPASCTTKPFYQIPGTPDQGDSVLDIDLPGSIGKALSITGFFLVFSAALSLIPPILLLISGIQPPAAQPPRKTPKADSTAKTASTPPAPLLPGTRAAFLIRNYTYGSIFLILWAMFISPVEIASWVAVGNIPDQMKGGLAKGSALLIAADVLMSISFLIIWFGGVFIRPKKRFTAYSR